MQDVSLWASAGVLCCFQLLTVILESFTKPALESIHMVLTVTVRLDGYINWVWFLHMKYPGLMKWMQPTGSFAQHSLRLSSTFIEEIRRAGFILVGNIREPVGQEGVDIGSLMCMLCQWKGTGCTGRAASFCLLPWLLNLRVLSSGCPRILFGPVLSKYVSAWDQTLLLKQLLINRGHRRSRYHRNTRWYTSLISIFI